MANKKIEVTYAVYATKEVEIDIPEEAKIVAMKVDGTPVLSEATGDVTTALRQILGSLGVNVIKIGKNEIPVAALVSLASLIPDLIKKLGIELK